MTSRNYCFTLNNYTNEEEKEIYIFFESYCKYGVYGYEIGKIENTPHLQGFFVLKNPARFKKVINDFVKRAHIEKCKGDYISNINYCSKDNKIVEFGNKNELGQGRRNDIKKFVENIKDNSNIYLIENYPVEYLKYYKAVDKIKFEYDKLLLNKFNEKLKVFVIIGWPGTGKTSYVFKKHNPENCFKIEDTETLWFNGYENQNVLIIDDFYGGIKYSYLLNLLDNYYMRLPTKGNFTISKWDYIYITSNKDVETWYNIYDISALKRRITEIIYL